MRKTMLSKMKVEITWIRSLIFKKFSQHPRLLIVCVESMMLLCMLWKPSSWTCLCVVLNFFPNYLEIFEQKMQWSILCVMNSHFSDSKCSTLCLTFCLLSGHSPVQEQAPDTAVYDQPRYSWKSPVLHSPMVLSQTESVHHHRWSRVCACLFQQLKFLRESSQV